MFRRIILAVLLTASCLAQDKTPTADVARMEQIIQAYVPSKFMGSVLVAQDGKVLLDKGYGFANLEWDSPQHADNEVPAGIDYQAVHGRVNPAAGGARQAEGGGPG